ncbi:MAG: hypothetical protein OEV71_06410 [Nitrospira sp.]|nr:hypothetical protein [Nitrospira sp.]MDH4342714.1 hypothetical protein [Nitrospira sp.]MDH5335901.1 hypothetical protein [Nitrospira sp.]
MLHTWVVSASCSDLTDQPRGGAYHASSRILSWVVAVVLCLSSSIGQAWGETSEEGKKTIVAAGFGYQIGTVSTIAVKVYDTESGVILSDDVYELSVKESDGVRSSRGPRVFAGGVGLGATDLSNFVLRVYDANTGVFQWEGRLNLVQPDGKAEGKLVSTVLPRHAIITKVQSVEATIEEPVFLLRAMDLATGMLVWEDEFTTASMKIPRAQLIAGPSLQPESSPPANSHAFNFSIRMYDPSGKKVLWEDQLSQRESDEGPEQSHSDQADLLPSWPNFSQEGSVAGSI